MFFFFSTVVCSSSLKIKVSHNKLENQYTNKGGRLLVEDATGQQVEVVLHRVNDHGVTCIVATLEKNKNVDFRSRRIRKRHIMRNGN